MRKFRARTCKPLRNVAKLRPKLQTVPERCRARRGRGRVRPGAAQVREREPEPRGACGRLAGLVAERRGRRRGRRPGGRRGSRTGAGGAARCARGRSGPPSTSRRASEPQITTAAGSRARRALRNRPSASSAESSRTRSPARRRKSSSAWTWTASTPSGEPESSSSTPSVAGRAAARRRAPCSQPVAQRHACSSSASPFGPSRGELERGQQHLLDGALDRADREALLELAVGGGLVEAVEGGDAGAAGEAGPRPRRRATSTALEMLLGLAQRLAQRLDLVELVQAVVAGGAARAAGSRAGAPSCAACSC